MARNKSTNPTEAELSILQVLWSHGPCTVRKVQEELNHKRKTGYTTVLKFLQIMTQKGLVVRDESSHAHLYQARWSEEQTQSQYVGDLMSRVFGGSARNMVMQALSVKKASSEELEEIQHLLDKLKGERS